MKIDLHQARQYLTALTGNTDAEVTFQTFADREKDRKDKAILARLTRVLHGTLEQHADTLERLNSERAGIYVTINETDGNGRKSDNIVALRSLFVDSDSGRMTGTPPLRPNIVTHSVAGDHVFWLLVPGEPLSEFTEAQSQLATVLGTDPSVKDRSRVMRLPGFMHWKGDPILVTCDVLHANRYTIKGILDAFPLQKSAAPPEPPEPPRKIPPSPHRSQQSAVERARAYMRRVPPAVEGAGGDVQTLKAACRAVRGFDLSDGDALDVLLEWNSHCSPPWSPEEIEAKIKGARRYGKERIGGLLEKPAPSRSYPVVIPQLPRSGPAATEDETDQVLAEADERDIEDTRPIIQYRSGEMHLAGDKICEVLAADPSVYTRARQLVRVSTAVTTEMPDGVMRNDEAPVVAAITEPNLQEIISRTTRGVRYDPKTNDLAPVNPPLPVVRAVQHRGEWPGMRVLKGISTVPPLSSMGGVYTERGYDQSTGYFHAPDGIVPSVSGNPTAAEVKSSLADLLEPLADFPFAGDAHRSVALAAILTVLARTAYEGNAGPLFAFDASTPSSGKSLLADVVGTITTGYGAARSPHVVNDDEMRKRITAHAMAGDQLILIDNAPGGSRIGCPSLDAALTGTVWSDRVLGSSRMSSLPFRAVWMLTGNNIGVRADAARRVLKCRLEVKDARPEKRDGFKHTPLLGWVRQRRHALVAAGLTILRAYMLAGRPERSLASLGSFEEWSDLVRGAIVWVGNPDPVACSATNDPDADQDESAHIQLLLHWHLLGKDSGLTSADIVRIIDREDSDLNPIRDAIKDFCPSKKGDGLPTARELGNKLRSIKDRHRVVGDNGDEAWLCGNVGHDKKTFWSVNGPGGMYTSPGGMLHFATSPAVTTEDNYSFTYRGDVGDVEDES